MTDYEAPYPKDEDELLAAIREVTTRPPALAQATATAMSGGYQWSADSMWKAALIAFNYAAGKAGCTGFQASWAELQFLKHSRRIEGPFSVVIYHDALYPQYDVVERVKEQLRAARPWLARQAHERLAGDLTHAHPDVVAHWVKTVRGFVHDPSIGPAPVAGSCYICGDRRDHDGARCPTGWSREDVDWARELRDSDQNLDPRR